MEWKAVFSGPSGRTEVCLWFLTHSPSSPNLNLLLPGNLLPQFITNWSHEDEKSWKVYGRLFPRQSKFSLGIKKPHHLTWKSFGLATGSLWSCFGVKGVLASLWLPHNWACAIPRPGHHGLWHKGEKLPTECLLSNSRLTALVGPLGAVPGLGGLQLPLNAETKHGCSDRIFCIPSHTWMRPKKNNNLFLY